MIGEIPKLTDMEIMIMGILWEQEKDMTVQEITEFLEDRKISASSVSQAVKHLLKKDAVVISGHRQVSNVYARVLCPNFSRDEFTRTEIERLGGKMSFRKRFRVVSAVVGLLKSDIKELNQEEIDELQEIIDQKKKELA